MGLREQMLGVLHGGEARRIRFEFIGTTGTAIAVNANSFSRVAQAIEENRIHLNQGGVAAGWAQYDAATNSFNVGRGQEWSRAFDALLIHESVHASFDLTRSTLPWLDNEVAAYLAQGFYLRNSGFSRSRLDHLGGPYLGLMILDSIVRGEGADSFFMDQLRGTLLSSPSYHSYIRGTFTGDG